MQDSASNTNLGTFPTNRGRKPRSAVPHRQGEVVNIHLFDGQSHNFSGRQVSYVLFPVKLFKVNIKLI
jgi:hypothetical protein